MPVRAFLSLLIVLLFPLSCLASDLAITENYHRDASRIAGAHQNGEGALIAILDTGINEIECLRGKVVAHKSFVETGSPSFDGNGHGTRLASIIAADGARGQLSGIAPRARLLDVKIADAEGEATDDTLAEGLAYARSQGATIINISFSSCAPSARVFSEIEKCTARGIRIVAAAGNDGSEEPRFPAAYPGVVAVGAKTASGGPAMYSGRGDWVDMYVREGIWTYDGREYSRQYGTSEAAAVVSAMIETPHSLAEKGKPGFGPWDVKYVAGSLESEGNAMFLGDEETDFLTSQAQYLGLAGKAQEFLGYMPRLRFYSLDDYTVNPTKQLNELFGAEYNAITALSHYDEQKKLCMLLLFDLFKNYVRLGYKDEFEEFNTQNQGCLQRLATTINDNHEWLESLRNANFQAGSVNSGTVDQLNDAADRVSNLLILLYNRTSGDNGTVAKRVRAFARSVCGITNKYGDGRGITAATFKNRLLAGKGNKAVVFAKYLSSFLKLCDIIKGAASAYVQYGTDTNYIQFCKLHAVDFVTRFITGWAGASREEALQELYPQGARPLGEAFVRYAAEFDGEDFDDFVDFAGTFSKVIFVKGASRALLADKIQKMFKGNPLGDIFMKIAGDAYNEYEALTFYDIYRQILYNLNYRVLYPDDYGYVAADQLQKSLVGSVIMRRFTFYAATFMHTCMKSTVNNTEFWSLLAKEAELYSVTESGIELTGEYESYLSPISIIENTLSLSHLWTLTGTVIDYKNYSDYVDEVCADLNAPTSDLPAVFGGINQLMIYIAFYEKSINQCMESESYYDAVSDSNLGIDETNAALLRAYIDSKEFLEEQESLQGQDDITAFMSYLYQLDTGVPLMTKRLFTSLDDDITRKDFFIMMLKGANYNPYSDLDFLRAFYKHDEAVVPVFEDLGQYYPETLSLNELIWLEYGKYKGVVNGYSGTELRPFEKISRAHAMAILGRLWQKRYEEINGSPYPMSLNASDAFYRGYGILDSASLTGEYAEYRQDIGWAVLAKLIRGAQVRTGEYNLQIDRRLSVRESQIISIRLFYELNTSQYMADRLVTEADGVLLSDDFCPITFMALKLWQEGAGVHPTIQKIIQGATSSDIQPLSKALYGMAGTVGVTAGKKNPLRLRTFITEEKRDKILLNWFTPVGKLTDFESGMNSEGHLETTVNYTPPLLSKETTVPIYVTVMATNGARYQKAYTVTVRPTDDYSADQASARGQLAAYYDSSTGKFKLRWNVNSATTSATVYSSFDKVTWTPCLGPINTSSTRTGYEEATLYGASSSTTAYFYIDASGADGTSSSPVVELAYKPVAIYTEKATEVPGRVELYSLGERTSLNQVTLRWRAVLDSHNNHNAVKYQIQYADNSSFENALFAERVYTESLSNLYETITKTITGLQDKTRYYFRVRALNNGQQEGRWSRTQYITIDAENLPVFSTGHRYPLNGAVDQSKTPELQWYCEDDDGDFLDYRVVMGTSPDNLNMVVRRFNDDDHRGQDWVNMEEEWNGPLTPGTTYYWQVWVKEKGHYQDYYGGEYIKTPVWRFTTETTGSDLAITSVTALDPIQPDSAVRFQVVVTNNGTETAQPRWIQGFYVKDEAESPFRTGLGVMTGALEPGQSETLIITVVFRDRVAEYNGVVYDNVLTADDSQVLFRFRYEDSQDIGDANNAAAAAITYNDTAGPVVDYFDLREYGALVNQETPFWARIGHDLQIVVNAHDERMVTACTVQIRPDEAAEWITLYQGDNEYDTLIFSEEGLRFPGSMERTQNSISWTVPESFPATTQAQVRVTLQDGSNSPTVHTSDAFAVKTNDLNGSIAATQPETQVGNDLAFTMDWNGGNTLIKYEVWLEYGAQSKLILSDYDAGGLVSAGAYQWAIPSSNTYASPFGRLKLYLRDDAGNERWVESGQFVIVDDTSVPAPFNQAVNLYDVHVAFPSDALYTEEGNGIRFVRMDDLDVAHVVVEHYHKYSRDTASGEGEDQFVWDNTKYYVTYDTATEVKSAPKALCDGAYDVVDFELLDGVPHALLEPTDGRRTLYETHLSGASFTAPVVVENGTVPTMSVPALKNTFTDTSGMYEANERSILVGDKLWKARVSNSTAYYRSVSANSIGGESTAGVTNLGADYESGFIRPATDGTSFAFIDPVDRKLVTVNTATNAASAADLPFTPNTSGGNRGNTVIGMAGGKTFVFGNGHVYELSGSSFIDMGEIAYTRDGQSKSYGDAWDDVINAWFVSDETGAYLILSGELGRPVPDYGSISREVLAFDPGSATFSKDVIELRGYPDRMPDPSRNSSLGNDRTALCAIGGGRALMASVMLYSPSSELRHYRSGASILDLRTGDVQYLGDLGLRSAAAVNVFKSGALFNVLALDAPNNRLTNKTFSLSDADARVARLRMPNLSEHEGRLWAVWAEGTPYDATWDDASDGQTGDLNRVNQARQVTPSVGGLVDFGLHLGTNTLITDTHIANAGGEIYALGGGMAVGAQVYDGGATNGSPVRLKDFDGQWASALGYYVSENSGVTVELFDGGMNKTSVPTRSQSVMLAAFGDKAVAVGYSSSHSGKHLVTKYDFASGEKVEIAFGRGDSGNNMEMADINANQYLAVGWDTYLAVADFSLDIVRPVISLDETPDTAHAGAPLTLAWSVDRDAAAVASFTVAAEINGVGTTLGTITDGTARSLVYAIPANAEGEVVFSVTATDVDGNIASASTSCAVLPAVVVSGIALSTPTAGAGERVTVSWNQANGDAGTDYSVKYRLHGTGDAALWFALNGVTSGTAPAPTRPGTYDVVVASSAAASEAVLASGLTVVGTGVSFVESSLNPSQKGWYDESRHLTLSWETGSALPLVYSVLVDTGAGFVGQGNTTDTSFEYAVPEGVDSLTWMVTTTVDGVRYESTAKAVEVAGLTSPDIGSVTVLGENTATPSVSVAFAPIPGIDEYWIMRSRETEIAKIGTSTNGTFDDETVDFGATYAYAVVSVSGGKAAPQGAAVSVTLEAEAVMGVSFVDAPSGPIEGNSLTVRYEPDREDVYERYAVYLGTSPDESELLCVTTLREVELTALPYNTTFYLKVYPLTQDDRLGTNVPASCSFTTGFASAALADRPVLQLDTVGEDHIDLSWSAVSGADSYRVYRCADLGEYEFVGIAYETSFKDFDGLASGTAYSYYVVASNAIASAESDRTQPVTVTDSVPDAPTVEVESDLFARPGVQVSLVGTGVEGSAAIVGYTWTQTAGEAVAIVDEDNATASFVVPEDSVDGDVFQFECEVIDAYGITAKGATQVSIGNQTTLTPIIMLLMQ